MTPWRHVAGLQITQNYQILAFIGLLILPFALPKHTDEPYIVEPTPALRIGDEELTTVLLVSNENRTASHGRYVNVRPDVGLLTSTARTFIQEGITTEYATQVLGTTLENGRIYAQLLKKSSRVLFDKESSIAPSNIGGVVHTSIIGEAPFQNYFQPKSLLQSHNDLVADKNWQDIDDRILFEKNSFVGNTDFVGNIPKPSFVVFPVKASTDRELTEKSSENFSKPEKTVTNSNKTAKIMADKVQPHIDLPTYTVKNMFSPSGFAWESDLDRQTDDNIEPLSLKNKSLFAVQRSPKLLYQKKNMKNAADSSRTLLTVTYYGFADFTTIVGDSVIVFSPSTSSAERNPMAQVTSITGKATLGPQEPSYVVKVPISITQDLIEPTFVNPMLSTNIDDLRVLPTDMREKNKDQGILREDTSVNDQETSVKDQETSVTLSEDNSEELEEKTTLSPNNDDSSPTTFDEDQEEPTTTTYLDDKNQFEPVVLVSSMVASEGTVESSAIQTPTEITSRVMLSRPSDEEILKIYSSLARAEAEKSSAQIQDSSTKEDVTQSSSTTSSTMTVEEATTSSTSTIEEDLIQPDIKVEGGATTVFFEDDPFVDFLDVSATESSRTIATVTQQLETITEAMQIDEEEQSTTEESETFSTTEETNEETEISTDSNMEKDDEGQLKPIIKEIEEDEEVSNCIRTSQVYLTQIPKTVTFYTTFFIPDEENAAETATSIETNIVPSFDIKQATKHYCIQSTPSAVLERPLSVEDDKNSQMLLEEVTTPMMIVRENAEVTESLENETTEVIDQDEDDEEESEEEIELIYKTLYTTYTYLTTFFHDSTTSVSSHKEIVTNVVTSSVSTPEVTATRSLDFNQTTSQHDSTHDDDSLHHSDLVQIDDILRETKPTEYLSDANVAKTYFTTYTYYTTIFVDGETEIMSRTEVHTNVVGKSDAGPSARNFQLDRDNAVIDLIPTATATYNTIERTAAISTDVANKSHAIHELESSSSSSSSRSERKIVPIVPSSEQLDNVDNAVLEDQISSESNTEEIVPFATLLLQTSYTTFTYYTTMYSNDATNVVSRLETITNVDTETLQPTKTLSLDEATLPITYFTTFTYWTKLEKDGEISTLKREETISNVVTPSISSDSSDSISKTEEMISSSSEEPSVSSNVPTTFYTTYTYFTTSYAGDKTVTDSRFETVTNLVTPSVSSLDVLESASMPSSSSSTEADIAVSSTPPLPPSTIEYDFKTIVDAEGISTLYSKTQVIETAVDGTLTTIASSSSTIKIDEVKKALSSTQEAASTKTYKTGLVRLISGTRFANRTTTVYQSKVIGTLIDQRYAQIIESTSSFIIEKTPVKSLELEITPTISSPVSVQTTALVLSTQTTEETLESSINDAKEEQESDNDSEDEEQDENGRSRTRLSFQTKKKTFTPVIRPFVSRNRPQFAPKRKNVLQSSATIITRSDLTPTITATPALKSDSRGRFSSSRKSNAGSSSSANVGNSSQAGKRFSRPSKSSQYGSYGSSSSYPGSSSRNRLQSSRGGQLQTSSVGGFPNSRRNGVNSRGSSTNVRSFSSVYPGNSRLRLRPSTSLPYDSQPNTAGYTTLPAESAEEDDTGVTQRYESEEEQDLTTENTRRNNNNLLRFRRPQLARPAFQAGGQRNLGQVTPRRIPSSQKPRTTTTTSTTTQRSRPRVSSRPVLFGQNRPQSSLFPPRRLFDKKTDEAPKSDIIEDSDGGKDEEESDYENDNEASEDEEQDILNRRRRQSSRSLVLSRSKRQTSNSFRNRFRRPTTAKVAVDERAEDPIHEDESSTVRSRASTRFTPRTHSLPTSNKSTNNNRAAIRPTKPHASSNRAQFTLREKDTTPKNSTPRLSTNFRRLLHNGASSPASSRRTTTTATSRSKTSRAKSYGNPITEPSHSSPRGRTPQTNGGRSRSSTSRSRSRNDFTPDPIVPPFNGTITVTHTTPTEITIPIVNGKVTEYKNVLTTTTSTEVVAPNQYTSILGQGGSSTLILNREETSINLNGATEITQFVLHETPTTTVIFTPTTIRGRKTSFAHMIPSTAYVVENVVSTMQPQIAANAPLANILLSQLLLGNLGSLNQQNINPLLALGAGAAATPVNLQNPGEPTTEYKTRSSTYVTTVGNGKSTIIPLTFHGKEILTTIYDSSSDVITATEYFTDTIVTTPTQQVQQVQQVNSLLLPYLLQQQQLQGLGQPQQQQQQQQLPQPVFPIQNTNPAQLLFPDNIQDLDHNGIQKYNDYGADIEDYPNNTQDDESNGSQRSSGSSRKKGSRKNHKQQHVAESSVITLYVSGRRPGEFSTVLSTVQVSPEPSLRKRQINRAQLRTRSTTSFDDYEDYYSSDGSEIEEYLLPLPPNKDIISSHNIKSNSLSLSEETQSLESIVGDVGLWYTKTSTLYSGNSAPVATSYDISQKLSSLSSDESQNVRANENDIMTTENFLV